MHLLLIASVSALTLSLAAKFLADALLDHRIPLAGSFIGLQYSLNPGIAFGLRLPPKAQDALIALALLFVCVLAVRSARTPLSNAAFGLIIGGALGNMLDRMRDGFVTDFFQVGTFPIFNVADSCITVGASLLLAESFGLLRRRGI